MDKIIHSFGFLNNFYQHSELISRLIKREIIGRYRGSFFGLLWSFITPILMLGIYTFVFGFVFKARWGVVHSNQYEFALILFSGLIVYNLFSECISQAPALILNHVNYVKKVVFPLEILPWVNLGAALFHALASLSILWVCLLFAGYSFTLNVLWLPVVILPFFLLIMGLSWFFAATGVFIRDIGQIISMILTVLMFLSPIFYPLESLPDEIRPFLYLNPVTVIVEQVRAVLIWGKPPNWIHLGYYSGVSFVIAWVGWNWFQKTRKGFADVL